MGNLPSAAFTLWRRGFTESPARDTAWVTSSRSNGFGTYSKTLCEPALRAVFTVLLPLMMITGICGRDWVSSGKLSNTSRPPIMTSVKTMSPCPACAHLISVSALSVAFTLWPARVRALERTRRTLSSSSASKTSYFITNVHPRVGARILFYRGAILLRRYRYGPPQPLRRVKGLAPALRVLC